MKKICVVTGTRAEYGLLYWLLKEIEADKELRTSSYSYRYALKSRVWTYISRQSKKSLK